MTGLIHIKGDLKMLENLLGGLDRSGRPSPEAKLLNRVRITVRNPSEE